MSNNKLIIYNTLNRRKEVFEPFSPGHVGMYVCGPTVYGEPHLGHARPAITYDLLFRYLRHLGYKVRYVRNITDVGHLVEEEGDTGEDKIGRRAKLERLEPMEIVQKYTNSYRYHMHELNVLPPCIEPVATGHIIEQIEIIKKIIDAGFAYESNGSVYFDVIKYSKQHHYGKLSGRKLEDMISNTRPLSGQEEKRSVVDFALWKSATPDHLMYWPSPWGSGFPGWHVECTAMSAKYLGEKFDIHGGGIDLVFPHHEAEMAQSIACTGHEPVRYWMHNNMITINGQKMGKSLGNFITLGDFFRGTHSLLERAYSPMTIRFFMLQAHYRSTLDFSNEALQAAEKGFRRLMRSVALLDTIEASSTSDTDIGALGRVCYEAMNDDLNSPVLIACLFDIAKVINNLHSKKISVTEKDLQALKSLYHNFVFDILGLLPDGKTDGEADNMALDGVIKLLLSLRQDAKEKKDWALADSIRGGLEKLGIMVKDVKGGFEWEFIDGRE